MKRSLAYGLPVLAIGSLTLVAVAWAQAENHHSSRSNKCPDDGCIRMVGPGPDMQITSQIDAKITLTIPDSGPPANGRKRFEMIVDTLLKQTKDDLMASYDKKHTR